MRVLLFLITIFIISGCSSKSSFLLPTKSNVTIAAKSIQIGVKQVNTPPYLEDDKILVMSGARVEEVGSKFVAPPKELLTQNAIKLLKSSLNDPYVFLYPWDVKEKKGVIVEINLDSFMYDSGYAKLEGSYYIKNANGNIENAKNFKLTQACNKDTETIVATLSKLFDKVVLEIAQKIAK